MDQNKNVDFNIPTSAPVRSPSDEQGAASGGEDHDFNGHPQVGATGVGRSENDSLSDSDSTEEN